jgi:hypothetical protein
LLQLKRIRPAWNCPTLYFRQLNLRVGDKVWLTEFPGGIELSPIDPETTEKTKAMHQVMRENREVLKKLADS